MAPDTDAWLKGLILAKESDLESTARTHFSAKVRLADVAVPRGTILVMEYASGERRIPALPHTEEELRSMNVCGVYDVNSSPLGDATIYQGKPFRKR